MATTRSKTDPAAAEQPVLVLFYPLEPCARCARACCTACPICRGPYCLKCVYDHHDAH